MGISDIVGQAFNSCLAQVLRQTCELLRTASTKCSVDDCLQLIHFRQ